MIRNSDEKFFEKARQAALLSNFKRTNIGCVAVYKGHIIAIGCNVCKTHPMQKKYNRYRKPRYMDRERIPGIHAEMHCLKVIQHMDINFSKVKLYIYRIRKDQPHGLSRPCPSCMAAIRDLGIQHIYYTTDNGYIYERIEQSMENNKVYY